MTCPLLPHKIDSLGNCGHKFRYNCGHIYISLILNNRLPIKCNLFLFESGHIYFILNNSLQIKIDYDTDDKENWLVWGSCHNVCPLVGMVPP